MSKDHANDLALPSLFDTDEPMFLTASGNERPLPSLTAAELIAMGGTGDDTNPNHEGGP